MALVDPDKADRVLEMVKQKYLKAYPLLEGKYMGALCDSADNMVINMKCIILAAGYATRLYPLTESFPKPLLRE